MDEFMNLPWGRLAILLVCIYLLLCAFVWLFADKVLFPVPLSPSYEEEFSNLKLETPKGNLIRCLHLKTPNPSLSIVYSHGNAEDLGMLESTLRNWTSSKWEIIAYDYPGYGLSGGNPSEAGCYEAVDAVYDYLVDELNRKPEQIVAWGRSLGTGLSTYLASGKNLAGIILEAPFLSAFRSLTEYDLFPMDRFRSYEYAKNIKSASLIIHGTMDQVIPFRHGFKLHQLLPEPKKFLEIHDAEHNDLSQVGGDRYESTIRDFLNSLLDG